MFAVTLNFVFLLIVGVGAVVTAISFLAFHQAFAPGVSTLVLILSFHVSTSRAGNSAASECKGDATLSSERFGLQPVVNGSYDRDFRCRSVFCAAGLANVSQKLASFRLLYADWWGALPDLLFSSWGDESLAKDKHPTWKVQGSSNHRKEIAISISADSLLRGRCN